MFSLPFMFCVITPKGKVPPNVPQPTPSWRHPRVKEVSPPENFVPEEDAAFVRAVVRRAYLVRRLDRDL